MRQRSTPSQAKGRDAVAHYLTGSAVDRIAIDFPVGRMFLERFLGMSPERLREFQEKRLAAVLDLAWSTPFYQRLWKTSGVTRHDIRSLDDLQYLPLVDKELIIADVEENPPFGSLAPLSHSRPRVLQTTSGTTGSPQPILWGARGREAQSAVLGRAYQWIGITHGDIVHSVYGHGLVNGGHWVREAVIRYTDAIILSAGTGLETRSERQIHIMQQFGPNVLVGFADYMRKLASVARDMGIRPGVDLRVDILIGHLTQGTRGDLESEWPGAKAFDIYGVADTGLIAGEGPDRNGMWIWEDANYVELLDPDTHVQIPPGEIGEMVVTSFTRDDVAPLIRFATRDLTRLCASPTEISLPFRRMQGMLGRSDQMVKLRGINVYPVLLGGLLSDLVDGTGEYVCRLERRPDGLDHLVVVLETAAPERNQHMEPLLARRLGVTVAVELVPPGATAELTGLLTRQKPLRLIDVR